MKHEYQAFKDHVLSKILCGLKMNFILSENHVVDLSRCCLDCYTTGGENGSVILARFINTYKCTKIESYLPVNSVEFLLNPLLVTETLVSTSPCFI